MRKTLSLALLAAAFLLSGCDGAVKPEATPDITSISTVSSVLSTREPSASPAAPADTVLNTPVPADSPVPAADEDEASPVVAASGSADAVTEAVPDSPEPQGEDYTVPVIDPASFSAESLSQDAEFCGLKYKTDPAWQTSETDRSVSYGFIVEPYVSSISLQGTETASAEALGQTPEQIAEHFSSVLGLTDAEASDGSFNGRTCWKLTGQMTDGQSAQGFIIPTKQYYISIMLLSADADSAWPVWDAFLSAVQLPE